ncbi:MAG: SPFH domain-containing protein, partial [Bacteroidota bacterium]
FKFIRFDATQYVIRYSNGKIQQAGQGLSFFYFAPKASVVSIPISSRDLPFIFEEKTHDFQPLSIQGQISFRVRDPEQLASVLDFTVNERKQYLTSDYEKLELRLINEAQTTVAAMIQQMPLREALRAMVLIEAKLRSGLETSPTLAQLGIELLGIQILAVKPSPEMARALETETRESLQQEADKAIYERRNFAVEQERRIKESELNTEIAMEEKQKQIKEKRMESAVIERENERKLLQMKMETDISVEKEKRTLIELKADNEKQNADTAEYVLRAKLAPYQDIDWRILTSLNSQNGDAKNQIALAFRELAGNADKIGSFHISPDLLSQLVQKG